MKLISAAAGIVFSLGITSAHAADRIHLDKVKTAILPTGGFYSIYEGTCDDNEGIAIASMERMTRWCFNAGGDLTCTREAQAAAHMACSRGSLAAARNTADPDGLE